LRHIKIAICKRDTSKDTFTGVLEQIQGKIDELVSTKIESQKAEVKKPKVDIKESYAISTQHLQRQIELL